MPIRSHVDMCLFIRFIHVLRENVPSEVIDLLARSPDRESMFKAWREQFFATPQVMFHETYHFWQGLRLPFLYRYAVLSFRVMYQAFRQLAVNPNLHSWDCILPELYRLNIPNRIWGLPGKGLCVGGPDAERPDLTESPLELTPLDLLEGAASVAEFQVFNLPDSRIDPILFSRWTKRNRAYTKAFKYVARALEDEQLALRIFLPLVNAAFHTTEPVQAFAMLLGTVWGTVRSSPEMKAFIAQPEPCRWTEVFSLFLDEVEFEAPPDSDGKILGSPFHRLTLRQWAFGSWGQIDNRDVAHPFLTYPARTWIEREDDNPIYSWLIEAPGWAEIDTFWECMRDFAPPLTFVRFHLDGKQDRVISLGEREYQFPLMDLVTIYSTVRRASGAHFDSDSRLCHHVHCPEYEPNFCNCYPVIPEDFANCTFRKRVETVRILTR